MKDIIYELNSGPSKYPINWTASPVECTFTFLSGVNSPGDISFVSIE